MEITADISLYPLTADYKPPIKRFIRELRGHEGLKIVTNQVSTQVSGDFTAVTTAINACVRDAMQRDMRVVFVMRYINAGLDIERAPDIG